MPADNRKAVTLPRGWQQVALEKIASVISGQSPTSDTYRKEPGGLPFFQGKADFGRVSPTARVWCVAPKTIAKPGDILISVRAPVGPTNVADVECCIGRGLAAIRCENSVEHDFILFFMKFHEHEIAQMGTGSTFESISRKHLLNIQIPLPPLAEQKRIVAVLNRRFAAVEKARAAALERVEAAQSLPAAWLREVFAFGGEGLPREWRWETLGNTCEINPRRPKEFDRADDKPTTFIPMDAVSATYGVVDKPQTRPYEEIKKGYTFFSDGDVLFAKITPCMQNGKHFIAAGSLDGVGFASTEFHVLRPGDSLLAEWAHFYLRQPAILKEATYHFTGTVGQQRVPDSFLKKLSIPLPPLAEQKRIIASLNAKMAATEKARAAAEAELDAITALPAALLREAFSGAL